MRIALMHGTQYRYGLEQKMTSAPVQGDLVAAVRYIERVFAPEFSPEWGMNATSE